MSEVRIPDFSEWKKDEYLDNYYIFETTLWEMPLLVSVSLGADATSEEIAAQKLCISEKVVEELQWIEEQQVALRKRIANRENIELAEDWASSAEPVDGKEDCYEMEDGQLVQCPISKEAFAASLQINSLGFDFAKGTGAFKLDGAALYVCCSPDYFAGHAIEVAITTDHITNVGSLVG